MNRVRKTLTENCRALSESSETFEDIYGILFSHGSDVMAETVGEYLTEKLTYREAGEKVEKLARRIASRFGSGEYIGLFGENSAGWLILFWAILKSGNKPYLINTRQPRSVCETVMKTLGVVNSVYTGEKNSRVPEGAVGLDELENEKTAEITAPFGNEVALTTSGTTGEVKICVYDGHAMSEEILDGLHAAKINRYVTETCNGNLKMLAVLPYYHIFGLQASYLWFSFYGASAVFPRDRSLDAAMRAARLSEVTHILAVPMFWNSVAKLAERERPDADLINKSLSKGRSCRKFASKRFADIRNKLLGDSVKFCVSGGSYIPEKTLKLINALGYPLYNGYGMTETGITSVELSENVKDRIRGSIGYPFPSAEYRTADDGSLEIKASSGSARIISDGENDPRGEWYHTGDIASEKDGGWYISGRLTDVVIGDDGENLDPDTAEAAFSFRDAKEFSVLGDEMGRLMLVIRVPDVFLEIQREHLVGEIKAGIDRLAPAYLKIQPYITKDPLSHEGAIKVSRKALLASINNGTVKLTAFSFDGRSDAVVSEVREEIRSIIADVLGIDREKVAGNAHFMHDLGGTSLDYFTLVSRIDDRFGVRLSFDGDGFGYDLDGITKQTELQLK